MRMKNIIIGLALIGCLSACSDDKEDPVVTLTSSQKIQNKWNFISSNDNYISPTGTIDSTDYFLGEGGDYIEFRTNNTYVFKAGGDKDTMPYKILGGTKIILASDTFTINTLTEKDFILTYSDRTSTPFYDNVVTLKR
jgi:hypothetical protein